PGAHPQAHRAPVGSAVGSIRNAGFAIWPSKSRSGCDGTARVDANESQAQELYYKFCLIITFGLAIDTFELRSDGLMPDSSSPGNGINRTTRYEHGSYTTFGRCKF